VRENEVQLAVPALPEYVRLARLTAAALAGQLGFSFDAVEDLRIAVDELCYLLVGSAGRPGSITLRFGADADALVIVGEGVAGEGRAEFGELSEQILAATVDEHTVTQHNGLVACRMVRHREHV
jgi:anti-sigma regulatory factor (Ser/Thr protein kinase)